MKWIIMTGWLLFGCLQGLQAGVVRGRVLDKQTREPLIGATVIAQESGAGAATDTEGYYTFRVAAGRYTFAVGYVGYKGIHSEPVNIGEEEEVVLNFDLESDSQNLQEVTVVAQARKDTEAAVARAQQVSFVVQSGVGARQIAKTQDKDASEVIRRIPGISIIDEQFVMVRGLSQRYNNVWINGGAVPSSEADSRAFSFDIIPSSQLENLTVVKSPAPEYPADFTGGFILIETRQQPIEEGLNLSLGWGVNTQTHFHSFLAARGSSTDWLGFDSGMRRLDAGASGALHTYSGYDNRIDLLNNGLNNDWRLREKHPWGNLKANLNYSRMWKTDGGAAWNLLVAANYGSTYKRLLDMENSLYGPYDIANQTPVYLRKATDNQWSHDVRAGVMTNLGFRPRDNRHFFEWKNILNQSGKDRYSERTGFNAQPDRINNMEYYYASRTAFNSQLTGRHTLARASFDWNAGYAYANRDLPDRRLIERTDRTEQTMGIYRIGREFTRLDEHIFSAGANYKQTFALGQFAPTLKTGLYAEHRTRQYRTRQFQYGWQPDNTLPQGFLFDPDVAGSVLTEANCGADKLYLYEEVNRLNDYDGLQNTLAAYLGINLPIGPLNIYAGCRYEHVRQILTMNTRQYEESWQDAVYDYDDLFPSVNATWRLNDRHQLRLAYGRSVNRPEFRELSSSVYYDFDLGSNVMGNYDLRAAYIQNLDLRYEYYPAPGEQLSVALFYKRFANPIEWTYTVAGGTDLIYSFINALGADNYGIEVDLRKDLGFMGLKHFSLSFNGAWIKSKVRFAPGSNNLDRPMQGQSPYLINLGLFYNHPGKGWNAAVLYNRIGKRIIGVGNRYGSTTDGTARNIPDSYEMPRNAIDLSLGKRIGRLEVRAAVRDVLAEPCRFTQYETFTAADGTPRTVEQVNRSFRPGRTFNLTVSYQF